MAFPFHSDGSDLVGLFCLDAGASGGASLVANAVSIHNELVRTAPRPGRRALRALRLRHARRGEAGHQALVPDAGVHAEGPTASSRATSGPTSSRPAATPTRRRRRRRRVRRWTVSTPCAPIPRSTCRCSFGPGDMQFVNNYHVLHARDAYTDDRPNGQGAPPEAPLARDARAHRRRQARGVPARRHHRHVVGGRPPRGGRARLSRRSHGRRPSAPPTSSPSTVRASRSSRRTRGTSAPPSCLSRSASRPCARRAAERPRPSGVSTDRWTARRPWPARARSRRPSTSP